MIINITPEEFEKLPPVKRLMAVKEHVLLNPEHFDMSDWCSSDEYDSCDCIACVKARKTDCNTTYCICGWTHLLMGSGSFDNNDIAQEWLGLPNDSLFYMEEDEALEYIDEMVAQGDN